jgi:hypothetical protein
MPNCGHIANLMVVDLVARSGVVITWASPEYLLKHANSALHCAKSKGRICRYILESDA